MNLHNNLILNLNLEHKKCLKASLKLIRIYRTNVALILIFPRRSKTILFPHSGFSDVRPLGKDKATLHMIMEEKHNLFFNNRSRSITPNNRITAIHNSRNPKHHSRSNTPPEHNSTNNYRNSPRLSTPLAMIYQIVDNKRKFSKLIL